MTIKTTGTKNGNTGDIITGSNEDFIKSDVKPEKYEKPETRPAPSPKPPKKKQE